MKDSNILGIDKSIKNLFNEVEEDLVTPARHIPKQQEQMIIAYRNYKRLIKNNYPINI